MSAVIQVDQLSREFKTRFPVSGALNKIKSIFLPSYQKVEAVSGVSFEVAEGERLAFIGPNGAGKSTVIKMLTGILYPSSGRVSVLGYTPWEERTKLAYHIGAVFGQRSQLWYHLPPKDTFKLLSKIYEIDMGIYQSRLDGLVSLFQLEQLIDKPVRKLSLGERMRCEIVASLLHMPKVLFLDEPTIGLDINAKLLIRNLLNQLSKEFKTTLFLTSHDTADIEKVCDRVIVLDKGEIISDTSIRTLKKTYARKKIVTLIPEKRGIDLQLEGVKALQVEDYHVQLEVDTTVIPLEEVIQKALSQTGLKDITIEDLSMEEVIRLLYRAGHEA